MNQFNIDLTKGEENNKDHPIASREAIYAALEKPMLFDDLFQALHSPKWSYEPVLKRVNAMVRDNQLVQKGIKYERAGESQLVTTKAFLDKYSNMHVNIDGIDLLLTDRHAQGVFPNDELVVRVPKPVKEDSIVVVVRINCINQSHIVCHVKEHRGKLRVLPFDTKIKQHIVLKGEKALKEGTVITVSRTDKQTSKRFLQVKLEKVLGDVDTPYIEREIARYVFKLSGAWSKDIMIEGASQKDIDSEMKDRTSWVDLPLVTIDGQDAKDYDDAVYVEKLDKGYRLYVAIADVSHYVELDSDLDVEARKRGNSVYFPGYVIPMLPEVLSNDICSLVPDQNRLAMGCCIEYDQNGKRVKTTLDKVVIRSHARLIYEDVDKMLEGKMDVPDFWKKGLEALNELALCLRKKRIKEGTIILTSRETKFDFDDKGNITSVIEMKRGFSHQMIEECMLAANMAVGYLMQEENMPIIYRCHNDPSNEKVEQFQEYLLSHHIELPDSPTPKDLQEVIDACKDKPDFHSIEMMVLRTLSQAFYCDEDVGHYALSTDFYTHFTSPIRRYVDLTVHRAIKAWLDKKEHQMPLEEIAENCSMLERRADEASWFVSGWLKAKWMAPNVGNTYDAKISSVTYFGIFVSLEGLPVEGLVHISNLGNEYFIHHSDTMKLEGRSSGLVYGLGQSLQVKLKSVSVPALQVDFEAVY